jgi:hypothetical protein
MKNYPYSKTNKIYCPDTGEHVTGDQYLASKHWKQMRVAAYQYYKGRCQRCGDQIPFSVVTIHHRVYKRMGQEKVTDLILYCSHCHTCIHKGRSLNHITNGDLQTLLYKFLTANERQEAFDLLVKHFDLDIDMIEKTKEEAIKKGIEKHRRKKIRQNNQKGKTRQPNGQS